MRGKRVCFRYAIATRHVRRRGTGSGSSLPFGERQDPPTSRINVRATAPAYLDPRALELGRSTETACRPLRVCVTAYWTG